MWRTEGKKKLDVIDESGCRVKRSYGGVSLNWDVLDVVPRFYFLMKTHSTGVRKSDSPTLTEESDFSLFHALDMSNTSNVQLKENSNVLSSMEFS